MLQPITVHPCLITSVATLVLERQHLNEEAPGRAEPHRHIRILKQLHLNLNTWYPAISVSQSPCQKSCNLDITAYNSNGKLVSVRLG